MTPDQQHPMDVPGFDRATGVDDPTPRAEYLDEPPEHDPRDRASTDDRCTACEHRPARHPVTAHFVDGPSLVMDLCDRCRGQIEDAGSPIEEPEAGP